MLSAAWLGIGLQFFSFFLSIARIKVLSDHFSVADYGLVTIYFSVVSFLSILVIFNTDRYIFRQSAENSQRAKPVLASLLLLPLFVGPLSLIYFSLDPKFSNFSLIAAINVVVVGAFHLFRFYLLGAGQTKAYSIFSFLMTNLWFIVLLLIIAHGERIALNAVLWLMLMSHVVLLVVSLISVRGVAHGDRAQVKLRQDILCAIGYSIGFLPIIISSRVFELADKYIVHELLSAHDMGILVMANSIIASVLAILSVLADLYRPYFSKFSAREIGEKISRQFLLIGLIGVYAACMVFISYGDWLFSKLLSRDFGVSSSIAMALLSSCAISFLVMYYVNILEREKASRQIAIAYTVGSVLYLLITVLMVTRFGLFGAVASSYIGNAIILIGLAHKRWQHLIPIIKDVVLFFAIGALSIAFANTLAGSVKAVFVVICVLVVCIAANHQLRNTAALTRSMSKI